MTQELHLVLAEERITRQRDKMRIKKFNFPEFEIFWENYKKHEKTFSETENCFTLTYSVQDYKAHIIGFRDHSLCFVLTIGGEEIFHSNIFSSSRKDRTRVWYNKTANELNEFFRERILQYTEF